MLYDSYDNIFATFIRLAAKRRAWFRQEEERRAVSCLEEEGIM
jgi:hypothetical protein